MRRKLIAAIVTVAMAAAMSMSVMAAPKTSQYPGWYFDNESKNWVNKGQWAQDENGWWYDLGDGTWLKNGRYTIDGDLDGQTEAYYFDQDGYMRTDYTTENGEYFNSDGHFVYFGSVHTTQILIPDPEADYNSDNGGYNSYGCSNAALEMLRSSREENQKFVEVGALDEAVGVSVVYANGFAVSYPKKGTSRYKMVAVTHTRADLDGTHLFKYYDGTMTPEQMYNSLLNKGWVRGISGRYVIWSGGSCSIKAAPEEGVLNYGGGLHGNSLHLRGFFE